MQRCRCVRLTRGAIAGATASVLVALAAEVVAPTTARADPPTGGTTIVSETFAGATVADSAWVAQGITCLTGAAAGTTPSPNIPRSPHRPRSSPTP